MNVPVSNTRYFLGLDGGGTKTECVLVDAEGTVLARSFAGASNPLRAGFTRAWFALSEAGDAVLRRQKIRAKDISGVCAGLGGAGRPSVVNRTTTFFQHSYPNAAVRVTTDLDVGLEAAFGTGEGILLLAGTGSAAFGRDSNGRTARAGGRGPWFSDEGSAFDIGRSAVRAVALFEEHRGPATALSKKIFSWNESGNWDVLLDQIAKNPDDVFPKMFPLVAKLADKDDAVAREILSAAARSLAELARCVASDLGWLDREFSIAKLGGIYGRSKYFDAEIDAALAKSLPRARTFHVETAPADAAAHMAIRLVAAKGNAA
jgi:N-acetylglucosamine kinase-like BadF-type ATPase